jgi:hypothetical protein
MPTPSSPILPSHPSPKLPTNRLLAPILQQETPPPSNFQFTDQMWTDLDITLQDADFANLFTDHPELNNDISFQYQDPNQPDLPPFEIQQSNAIPSPKPTSTTASRKPFVAPIPPPPQPVPTPERLLKHKSPKKGKRRGSNAKQPKPKRQKKEKAELTLPSSPPLRAFDTFTLEDFESLLASEDLDDSLFALEEDNADPLPASWHEFLHQNQSDTEPSILNDAREPSPLPHVGFTAVNSTLQASREFTARQILLNAEFTPNSSPEHSPASQTETLTDTDSPTAAEETPLAAPSPVQKERKALSDVTSHISAMENIELPQKKKPGRPKGWRKTQNSENPVLPIMQLEENVKKPGKPKGRPPTHSTVKTDDEAWSSRVRGNIKDVMLEKLAKGIFFDLKLMKASYLLCVLVVAILRRHYGDT